MILLVLLAVCALFFYHLHYGSYQSTHGPTAAPGFLLGFLAFLLALQLRMRLDLSLADLGHAESSTVHRIDPPDQGKFRTLLC